MAKTRSILDSFDLFGCFTSAPTLFQRAGTCASASGRRISPANPMPCRGVLLTPSQTIRGAGTAPPQFTFRMILLASNEPTIITDMAPIVTSTCAMAYSTHYKIRVQT